jgi:hypothetical protein
MRQLSVELFNLNNQQKSSMNDDPFDLKGLVTGVTKVNHQKNLYDFAEELVAHYAKFSNDQYELSLDMLPNDDQNELARLYIEAHDREVNECIYGDDFTINSDFICSLLSLLKDNSSKNRELFAETTLRNILIYFKCSLEELLDTSCENYLHNMNYENGIFAYQDLDHDDVSWRKF